MAGDLNEHTNSKVVESYFAKIGIRELITEKHGKKFPATKTRNKNHKAVDRIWETIGLSIEKGGYLPYNLGIKSDHHIIWVKMVTSIALVYQPYLSKSPAYRNLRLHNPKGQKKYTSNLKQLVKQHNLPPWLRRL